ncbi:MAG: pyridoxamine 5'-phosphate oxidase family protein [Parcubacteria group bacterium]|nr:pyridoxamine 5'-phosphate oxidase family protein [Parcubacteria group bacterium]
MDNNKKKRKVLDFIKSQKLGVLSTVSEDGLPEVAVVGISEMDNLSLIFGTFKQYRKYTNLKQNPRVAVVIGWGNMTVQYEGTAKELIGKEKEKAKQIHIKKLPSSKKFAKLAEQCYFRISPSWIRFTDYSRDSIYGEVFEINFNSK